MGRKLLILLGLVLMVGTLGRMLRPDKETTPDSPALSGSRAQAQGTTVVEGIGVGQRAPDFTLQDGNGRAVRLSDLRGKPVFMNFWATWCPPCRVEMPEMQQVYEEQGEAFHMVAVNLTATEKSDAAVPAFLNQNGYTFPVPLDSEGEVSSRYAVVAVPTSYFIDENGIIRVVWRGPMDRTTMLANLAQARRAQ